MRCLVTGAKGFLGSFLTQKLREQGNIVDEVVSKECDLRNRDALFETFPETYERIYHLAAWTQAGDFCLKHPGEQWLNNQQINTNVLAYWQNRQPHAKLIAIGTSCSYAPDLPLVEENYMHGTPIDSLYTYAMTKRILFAGIMALHKQYGMEYLHVIPSTLYGPNYHLDGRQMHFIFDLIRKILNAKHRGEKVTLWGDGNQKRELVFIDDFIDALFFLDSTASNETFNIGMGAEYSIREFAEAICELVGYDPEKIEYDTTKYVGAKSKVLSIQKLKERYPNYRQTPLKEGLAQVIEWFETSFFAQASLS